MKTVTDVGAAEPPTAFVSNVLQIAVPKEIRAGSGD